MKKSEKEALEKRITELEQQVAALKAQAPLVTTHYIFVEKEQPSLPHWTVPYPIITCGGNSTTTSTGASFRFND
jgi:hypothetical protein